MNKCLIGFLAILILQSCSKGDAVSPAPTPPSTPVLEIGTFSLELPENNKDCESGVVNLDKSDVEFKWKAATNATKYELKITDILSGSSSSITDIVSNSKVVSLSRGKSYAWSVTASNSAGKFVTSNNWKFYLVGEGKVNRAPFPANPIYPIPGSTVTLNAQGNIKFEWNTEDPDKDELSFTLRIDTLNNQKYTGVSFDVKSNKFQEVKLIPGKIYYWSVISKDPTISVKSDLFTFNLK